MISGFAPAKINLFLHVGPLGSEGFHPIQSWMVFADVGDRLALTEAGFRLTGPFAGGVPTDASNLAIRARDAFLAVSGGPLVGLTLEKNLPPASGIGGGSSDAAAVLRLLQDRHPLPKDDLDRIALSLGADVPACLVRHGLIASGRGEALSKAPSIPPLPAVLVNPGREVSTAKVFWSYDETPPAPAEVWRFDDGLADVSEAVELLATTTSNDLQAAAERLEPAILDVLRELQRDSRSRLTRMSGSGATCFTLCESRDDAVSLAADLAAARPGWWVQATTLA